MAGRPLDTYELITLLTRRQVIFMPIRDEARPQKNRHVLQHLLARNFVAEIEAQEKPLGKHQLLIGSSEVM